MSEPSSPSNKAVGWTNWAGDQACRPAEVRHPASVAELCETVAAASQQGLRVRVAGSGHSFSDVACVNGLMLQLDRMTSVLDVDRESRLARVQAGITIRELSRELDRHGLALDNRGDIDVPTSAG